MKSCIELDLGILYLSYPISQIVLKFFKKFMNIVKKLFIKIRLPQSLKSFKNIYKSQLQYDKKFGVGLNNSIFELPSNICQTNFFY